MQIMSILDGKSMTSNFKVEKRPRNFYGANVATLGVFQTESALSFQSHILNTMSAKKFVEVLCIFLDLCIFSFSFAIPLET